jgi:hypothetical protein
MTDMTAAVAGTRTSQGGSLARALAPLVLDIGVPLGGYYLLRRGMGVDVVTALTVTSVVPAARTLWGVVRDRSVNQLAALMLATTVLGIVLSYVTGDPRLMIAKDSATSSVVALAIIFSTFAGRPLMSAALQPMFTRGDAAKTAAWNRMSTTSTVFRRLERRYSLVWGGALLAECLVRLVGAFTVPVDTMVGASTLILLGGIAIGIAANGHTASEMKEMVNADL